MELPAPFRKRMQEELGEEAETFFASLDRAPCRAFRYDPSRIRPERLRALLGEQLGEAIPYLEHAYRFTVSGIGQHPLHHGGALYVQEPAAMAPVAALSGERVSSVLDLCSSPGGKGTQAARDLLTPDGILVLNEPDPRRCKVLMQNVERLGLARALVSSRDGRCLPSAWRERFELVICDAPCSGEGMMRKDETARMDWSEEKILRLSALQKELLSSAAACVAPNGLLLYATCTWSRRENEEVVADFLEKHGDFSPLPPSPALCPYGRVTEHGAIRFYPHLFDGEGQFFAVFRRQTEGTGPVRIRTKKEKKPSRPHPSLAVAEDFLKRQLSAMPTGRLIPREDRVYLFPETELSPEDFLSPGVLLGTVQRGRFVPHHRLFTALAAFFSRRVTLSWEDPRIGRYLAGEELALEGEEGFGVLFAEDCPLGGIKISGGRAKNHYPKGLRNQE